MKPVQNLDQINPFTGLPNIEFIPTTEYLPDVGTEMETGFWFWFAWGYISFLKLGQKSHKLSNLTFFYPRNNSFVRLYLAFVVNNQKTEVAKI